MVAVLMGGTIIGAEAFLTGCKTTPTQTGLFADTDGALLDEIGETILPVTPDSPGAKDARIGDFMKLIVTDCYSPRDQKVFLNGLQALKDKGFMNMTAAQKHDLLVGLDKEAKDYDKANDDKAPKTHPDPTAWVDPDAGAAKHYFTMMKQLTIWGFFSSEPGATKACRYVPVPGRFDGDVPYKKGDKGWATSSAT
ncbi:gluconate 2-dehydrogenase subunit 3-like protein [Dinghuibacter silviterrae]|uniref:Gluconate 2-dehydrogenase subunit 3-like protein n=2 Tax=Dinghuibacter silviterrae TaxID=1539049 RepID=A0A4R8DFJ8_9BACT|nr:gluconate 2-dehydrogenase subunit 3-like protein [Dinghuibacter silviterrae]